LVEFCGMTTIINSWVKPGNGQAALHLCIEVKPDIVVLDAKLAGFLNGVDILRRLNKRLPNLRVLVLFRSRRDPIFGAGNDRSGSPRFSSRRPRAFRVQGKALRRLRRRHLFRAGGGGPASQCRGQSQLQQHPDFLTDREREILQLIAESQ